MSSSSEKLSLESTISNYQQAQRIVTLAKTLILMGGETLNSKEILNKDKVYLACGSGNSELAQKTADLLGMKIDHTMNPNGPMSKASRRRYPDGEVCPELAESIHKKEVFIIQSPSPRLPIPNSNPPKETSGINDHIVELATMIDASQRAGAKETYVIMPYFPYARQDRKDRPRVPISASWLAKMLEDSGADHLYAMDLHSEQITGSVQIPFDVNYASYVLCPWIRENLDLNNLMVFSPDGGAFKMACKYSEIILGHEEAGVIFKERDTRTGQTRIMTTIGDVGGKDVLIVDDMAASCGTLTRAARALKEQGARDVYAAASHGLFVNDALEKIKSCQALQRIITTDSIQHRPDILEEAKQKNRKIEIVSTAPLIAETIRCIANGESTQHLFLDNSGS